MVGLLAIVALIVAVLFIMHRLNQAAQIQDCVASGRTNCAPIETQRHGELIDSWYRCSLIQPRFDLLERISSTLRKNAPYAIWNASRIAVPDGITRRIARSGASTPNSTLPHAPSA